MMSNLRLEGSARRSRARHSGLRRAAVASLAVAVAGWSGTARAIDVENVGGQTLTIDVTNTAIVDYLFDNRNDSTVVVAPPATLLDDTYGELIDHLNVQLFYWRFRAGVRLDGYAYFAQLDDEDMQAIAKEQLPEASGAERYDYENGFRRELHTRYRNTLYPAKLFVGYTAPSVDLTLGDFYAQLGRGLVLSVRKIDEVGQDTTIRGFKGSFKKSWGDASLSVTALAGEANPLRVDDQSGRQLSAAGSPLFFGFPAPHDYTFYSFDGTGYAGYTTAKARPGYLEDAVYGLSVEAGPRQVLFGAHASLIDRKSNAESNARCGAAGASGCDAAFPVFGTNNLARLHDMILSASGSVNVPNLWGAGDLYGEVVVQHAADGRVTGLDDQRALVATPDNTGYGLYLSGALHGGPVTVTLEGKHYHSLLPLSANVNADASSDTVFAAPEFDSVGYNQPPNADSDYQEPIGSPNVCISGGRARVDYAANKWLTAYGWLSFYDSTTEVNTQNASCSTDDPRLETRTFDGAAGADMSLEGGKSFFKAWVGARNTSRAEPADSPNAEGLIDGFYREGYVRYDVAKHIAGDFTLEAQGFHRHRYEPTIAADAWNEGENYLALKWAPRLAFIFGFEYLGRRGCAPDPDTQACFYFSGGAQYKSPTKDNVAEMFFDTVNLFVGQRRGAIRCVSGVCRQYPPFEGAKLELTSRF